jgi:hypothetical protein
LTLLFSNRYKHSESPSLPALFPYEVGCIIICHPHVMTGNPTTPMIWLTNSI